MVKVTVFLVDSLARAGELVTASPPIVRVHFDASMFCGTSPLLRINIKSLEVTSLSKRCGGVSATKGLSPRTTNSRLLPATFRSAIVGPAMATGTRPPGRFFTKGISPPTAAAIASSALFLKNPLRFNILFSSI